MVASTLEQLTVALLGVLLSARTAVNANSQGDAITENANVIGHEMHAGLESSS